jgi:hypothetical protein
VSISINKNRQNFKKQRLPSQIENSEVNTAEGTPKKINIFTPILPSESHSLIKSYIDARPDPYPDA